MIDLFTAFCDILVYPLYHITADSFTGILFYLLLFAFVANLLISLLHIPSKLRKVKL